MTTAVDPDVRRLANTRGITARHVDVWQAIVDWNAVAGTEPLGTRRIAKVTGIHKLEVSQILAYLEFRGWIHREKRKGDDGRDTTSRLLATVPHDRRHRERRHLERLMRQAPGDRR